MRARIVKSAKRDFDCSLENGEIVKATALATLIKGSDDHLVVGDYVTLEEIEDGWVIASVEERQNEIFRIIPREKTRKIIASNCDLLVIVASVSKPQYKMGLIDRYLVRAQQWGIPAIIVYNKMDEFNDQFDFELNRSRFEDLVVDQYEVSAKFSGYTNRFGLKGVPELKKDLEGKTAICLGQSGVGKSKLITGLCEKEVELKSAEIGKIGKGKHTTTWAELISLDNFSLIDSPGIRSYALDDLFLENLIEYFPDIEEQSLQCQFSDCSHDEKAKGCSFYLDENASKLSRLQSFLKIRDEVSKTPDWKKRKN